MTIKKQKTIHLALQGGGAHGAYTWGVLDKLIEDGRISFDGICATSAGSMNASVFSYGMIKNGPDGAREGMHNFWQAISKSNNMFGETPEPLNKIARHISHSLFETFSHFLSPYEFNPFNYNSLRDIVDKQVDFDELKNSKLSNLYISATNVKTGKVRIFNNSELSLDVVMASACLPYVFQAVKVDKDYYWDGGFMGNPAIFPLFYNNHDTRDVLIVHINPIIREKIPKKSSQILNRINEITFNSSLLAELRAIAFANKILTEGWLKKEHEHKLKHILVHAIRADKSLINYDVSSKFDTHWKFLTHLKDLGREQANIWLEKNFHELGKKSTVDLKKEYLTSNNDIV